MGNAYKRHYISTLKIFLHSFCMDYDRSLSAGFHSFHIFKRTKSFQSILQCMLVSFHLYDAHPKNYHPFV